MNDSVAVRHLSKSYPKFQLKDVSFTVPRGTIVGLIGENGAGKSTTLKAILGLIRKDRGEISVLGESTLTSRVKEEVGVVFDQNRFHETLTPGEVGKIFSRLYRQWDGELYQSYLKRFQLPEDQKIKGFSKGMKVKLNIAAALSHRPKLLLLDEATSGLDPVAREEILDLFQEFIQDEACSILFSSHITSDLDRIADYIVFLHRGKVAFQREKDRLLDEMGVAHMEESALASLDASERVRVRRGRFGVDVLIDGRGRWKRNHPNIPVDPVSIQDIMLFYAKGDFQ